MQPLVAAGVGIAALACLMWRRNGITRVETHDPTVVACLGDSITAGFWQRTEDLWPSRLQEALGDEWRIVNLGKAGHTAQREGDQPYWATKEWARAKEMDADVVILMLGTNVRPERTRTSHWSHPCDAKFSCHKKHL